MLVISRTQSKSEWSFNASTSKSQGETDESGRRVDLKLYVWLRELNNQIIICYRFLGTGSGAEACFGEVRSEDTLEQEL